MNENYIFTRSGGRVYFDEPENSDFNIEDIAWGLAMTARWCGQSKVFVSVAQHCCIVHDMLPDALKLQGLMHDASEAYLHDITRPLKRMLSEYKAIEALMEQALANKYEYAYPYDEQVKLADNMAMAQEVRDIINVPGDFTHSFGESFLSQYRVQELTYRKLGLPAPVSDILVPMNMHKAHDEFMLRFNRMTKVVVNGREKARAPEIF